MTYFSSYPHTGLFPYFFLFNLVAYIDLNCNVKNVGKKYRSINRGDKKKIINCQIFKKSFVIYLFSTLAALKLTPDLRTSRPISDHIQESDHMCVR